jgi:hypothetical protein
MNLFEIYKTLIIPHGNFIRLVVPWLEYEELDLSQL